MAFRANELSNEERHVIICWNEPILRTCVWLGMANKFFCLSFLFVAQKMHFPFLNAKNGFSCETVLEASYILIQPLCTKILDHSNTMFVIPAVVENVLRISENLYSFLPISLELDRI
jgi:hypothetical protein